VIETLAPLADLPGVELVMLVTPDGVPVAVPGRSPVRLEPRAEEVEPDANDDEDELAGRSGSSERPLSREEKLAALATGWLADLRGAAGLCSWTEPRRAVLEGARGTLVLLRTRSAVLFALLEQGLDPDQLRLPMEGAAARIERSLRDLGSQLAEAKAEPATPHELPGPVPSDAQALRPDRVKAEAQAYLRRMHRSGN
jgi:predicted regulator of Ras-like GTPase activity (Roadblock/LC7/MglB family)